MKKITSFLSILLVIMLVNVSFASSLYKDRAKINNSIQENKNKIKTIQAKKDKVQKSILEVIEKKNELIERIEKTKKDIDKKEKELEVIKASLVKAIKKIKKQEKDFSKRVRLMYERSQESTIEIFLKSRGITEFMNRLDFARIVAKQDSRVLRDYKAQKEKVKKLQEVEKKNLEQLNVLKEKQQKSKTELVAVENELKARAAELQKEIDAEKRSIAKKRAQLNSLSEAIRAYEAKIAAKQVEPINVNRGANSKGWVWPLPYTRNITSPFGPRIHPVLGVGRPHQGIDIGNKAIYTYGRPIVAAKDGVVVKAVIDTSKQGYGTHVGIYHGNGVSTIYGHCSVLHVRVGQRVKAGQVIARVGNTGRSTAAHLHFGVRVGGPYGPYVNPLRYVR